jgi:hypothetical protein
LTNMANHHTGGLKAMITCKGVRSDVNHIATIVAVRPEVVATAHKVARFTTDGSTDTALLTPSLYISGSNFGFDAAKISVTVTAEGVNLATAATPTYCHDNTLAVGLVLVSSPAFTGEARIFAKVTHLINGHSGSPTPVAVFSQEAIFVPTITAITSDVPSSATAMTIKGSGFGFSTVGHLKDIKIYLYPAAGQAPTAKIHNVQPTNMTFFVEGMTDANMGALSAVVVVHGVTSASSQVKYILLQHIIQ